MYHRHVDLGPLDETTDHCMYHRHIDLVLWIRQQCEVLVLCLYHMHVDITDGSKTITTSNIIPAKF